ncbi:MAG: calcium/sodium antiporter [Hyphomicrobium sp.]
MSDILMLLGGLLLLATGGEFLVRGAVAVAERLGMSPLLIGLTLVGFGTSTPELVTSVQAAMAGAPGIAIGNIVGSNIANLLLILGLSALITPIVVGSKALKRDGVLVLAAALIFTAIGYFGVLDRPAAVALILCLVAYLWFAYTQERVPAAGGHSAAYEKAEAYEELHTGPIGHAAGTGSKDKQSGLLLPIVMALAGLVIVVFGGKLLVDAATAIARNAGISETVIGLTIVAIGTSMPEFVTSLVAALRKHADVALGNIMGSNIYNVLGIGGVTGLLAPGPTPIPAEIAGFDNLVMVAASLAMLVFAWTGLRIGRLEGAALLAGYVAYIFVLWPK